MKYACERCNKIIESMRKCKHVQIRQNADILGDYVLCEKCHDLLCDFIDGYEIYYNNEMIAKSCDLDEE